MTPGLRLVDSLPWATRKEDKLPLQAFREALLSSCSGDDALFGTLDDASWCDVGVSKNRGTPKWMVYIMENPIKMG